MKYKYFISYVTPDGVGISIEEDIKRDSGLSNISVINYILMDIQPK